MFSQNIKMFRSWKIKQKKTKYHTTSLERLYLTQTLSHLGRTYNTLRSKIYKIYSIIYNGQRACSVLKATPSEKTKLYLTKKLSEIEIKLKRIEEEKDYTSDNR